MACRYAPKKYENSCFDIFQGFQNSVKQLGFCLEININWFGISHIVYKNKRMEVAKVFWLFDSLVKPVALHGCEFWLPLKLPQQSSKTEKIYLIIGKHLIVKKLTKSVAE